MMPIGQATKLSNGVVSLLMLARRRHFVIHQFLRLSVGVNKMHVQVYTALRLVLDTEQSLTCSSALYPDSL